MVRYAITLATLCALVSGCAANKTPVPTGGSRADGVIELSYEVGAFEKPVVDWDTGMTSASQRCQSWGYDDAEPFGGQTAVCQFYNSNGVCLRRLITVPFQCIGGQ